MKAAQRRAPDASGNRRMATINEMLDDITDEILQREPFDQQTEVLVDPSLNYGLDLYHVITGNESFESREQVIESDGLHFVDQINDLHVVDEDEEAEEENVITEEMKTFNSFFKEAVEDLKQQNTNPQRPRVEERRTESQFTLRRIEAAFSQSDVKLKLLESLKTIGAEKGWYKKVDNFTAKLMNDNITSNNDIPFQDYFEQVSEYGLKTMPRTMCDKIKTEVSAFVKQFTKPFDEIYAEAVAEAATVTPDEITKMRQLLIKSAPLKPEIVYIGGPAMAYEISTQTEPVSNEVGSQTIEGLGTIDDKDFESIVQNDAVEEVQMAPQPVSEYHSEEEPGVMSKEDEEAVITKLETEIEKRKRIREDMHKALNPKLGLYLSKEYPDHRQLIKKIKEMAEFEIKAYEESYAQQTDKSLPPPEILTLKWNGKIYKFVTTFSWTYPTIDEKLPPEKRRMRPQKNENVYSYIPPPSPEPLIKRPPVDMSEFESLFPKFKRRFGLLEEYPPCKTRRAPKPRRPRFSLHPCAYLGIRDKYEWNENNQRVRIERNSDSEYSGSDEDDSDSDKSNSDVDIEGFSDAGDDKINKSQFLPVYDPEEYSGTDSDEDDRSSGDSNEYLITGRKRRKQQKAEKVLSKGVKKARSKITVETEAMDLQESPASTSEDLQEEESDEENGENNYDGIESCDEDELWDDFIPDRVFAEKCPFRNTYIDEF